MVLAFVGLTPLMTGQPQFKWYELPQRQERADFFPVLLVTRAEATDQHRVFYADAVGVRGRCHRHRYNERQQIAGGERDAIERQERSE